MRPSAIATWRIHLYVDCPHCGWRNDAIGDWHQNDGWELVKVGESKKLNARVDYPDFPMKCEKCKKDFSIGETQY